MPNCTLHHIEVTPSSYKMKPGNNLQLNAIPYDNSNNVQHGSVITWTSLNTNIATVSAGGVVTGVAKGTVSIVAASGGTQSDATITVQ